MSVCPSVHARDIERGMRDKGWVKKRGGGGRQEGAELRGREKGIDRGEGQETVGGNDGK